jgi:hypothetical protein
MWDMGICGIWECVGYGNMWDMEIWGYVGYGNMQDMGICGV